MAPGFGLICLAAVTAFLGAVLCAVWAVESILNRARTSRMHRRAGSDDAAHRRARTGYPLFAPVAKRLLAVEAFSRRCESWCAAMRSRGFPCTTESLCTLLCGIALMLFAIGAAIARSWVIGAAVVCCAAAIGAATASRDLESRRQRMHEALPDALRAMGVCFHAGFTLQQTFAQLRRECAGPIKDVFEQASQAIDVGESAQSALSKLQGPGSVPELAFVSVALAVQHQTGGSMRHVLDSTCETLESELELRRSLRVHTAQAKLSARVVTGVTVALVAVLSLLSENFLGPFFESAPGIMMLALALAMQVAGVLTVRKLLHIEVD